MILGINQYGEKYYFKDARKKTILETLGYKSIQSMFIDDKEGKQHKIGYVCSLRGYNSLWIQLYDITQHKFKEA